MSEPRSELMQLPAEYGTAAEALDWSVAQDKLETSVMYWLSTVRADGSVHTVPRDGVWMDGLLWYGGSDATVHNKIIAKRPNVNLHIGEGLEAVIVDAVAQHRIPTPEQAQRLADLSMKKYPQYGEAKASDYAQGVWTLKPVRALAWTKFPTNCTRFEFD
jgi:hypothetical protein